MFPKGLIVSCQALSGNPFRNSEGLAMMAEAAEKGGAVAIRANGVEDITAIRKRTSIPIIGINKRVDGTGRTVITPTFEDSKAVVDAGANIIALDCVKYQSDIRENPYEHIKRLHDELGVMVMADISTAEEAYLADKAGVDAISTTLAGYVPGALHTEEELYIPNFDLLKEIIDMKLNCSIIAEGRFWRIEDVINAFEMGVDGMVIGKAITNPMAITKYFVNGIKRIKG